MTVDVKIGVLLCFVLVTVVCGKSLTNFKTCSANANVESVSVNNGTAPVAQLKRGTQAVLEIKFKSKVNVNKIKSICHGIIGGLPVPFPLPSDDGCVGLTPGCPVKAGQEYTFVTKIDVKKEYPNMRLIVKWEEQQEASNDDDVFCIEIPAVIVS